jgi:regulatory associated protein of mTOR
VATVCPDMCVINSRGTGKCLVGGDTKVIRMYDAGNETFVSNFDARSESPITSLTSDQVAGHYFVAGFGDGAVCAYDTRLDNRNPLVRTWKQHKSWIVNVYMRRNGIRELVTGSIAGEVKLFEYSLIVNFLTCSIQQDQPVRTIQVHTTEMHCLAVHQHAPVFATGCTSSSFKVWNLDGTNLSTSRHQARVLRQGQTAGIASLSFHPHAMVLAESGYMDGRVRLLLGNPLP